MKLYPDTKVYVLCPGNVQTGGPESLHRLASQLISFGVQALMVYYALSHTRLNREDPVHPLYKKYHVPYTREPEDNEHNIVIAPEPATEFLYSFNKTQRVIWWMSVNKYLSHISKLFNHHLKSPLQSPLIKFFCFRKEDDEIEHWGQSEYVRQFLRLNGVMKIHTVETPMNQIFLRRATRIDLSRKENFVAFNPLKGFEVTKQLMELAPDIDWRPIEDMTPAQVQESLAQSKIYIDFGEFPGRERLPREAALSGCVVIVGKRGAAANDVDINIPDEFKFNLQAKPQAVIKKIREVFENFETALSSQKAFRDKELDAQKIFTAEVVDTFEIKELPPPAVALVQNVDEDFISRVQKIFKDKDFTLSFIVDDWLSSDEAANLFEGIVFRRQNRNYFNVGGGLVEVITRDDAKFLYLEGRIKKFALLEPTDAELAELKDFYEADEADVLIFNR